MWHATKRWLYLIHRWIGIATCLLFVMWFASGLVMLHVPFPDLSEEEQLDGLAPIAWNAVVHVPQVDRAWREAALEMRGQRPVWRLQPWEGKSRSVWADDGRPAGVTGEAEALAIASAFASREVTMLRRIHSDQWTVAGGYDAHRPLWQAELAGPGGQVLYISSTSGQVVLDTSRWERGWNWLGSVPHWLYPRALREDQPLWRQVVMWASGPCILVALTGTWIGLMRLRSGRRRFKDGRMTPYRGWMKWHHLSGLIGAVFLILWIFSGWLSVDPFRLFASERPGLAEQRAYAGSAPLPLGAVKGLSAADARRVTVQAAADAPFVTVQRDDSPPLLLDAALQPLEEDRARLEQAARLLVPGAQLLAVDRLTRPDAYWYAVRGQAPLPVLRLRFGDTAQTWLHLDPRTGEVLGGGDVKRRTYRWLFDLFHRWDLTLLLDARPAREVLIWLMSLVGLIGSASGVVIGWRRARRKFA